MSRMGGCRIALTPAPEDVEAEAEIRANGGNMTAVELCHGRQYHYTGSAWSRRRAEAWIREKRKEGQWLDAHAHDDGSIYIEET